MPARTRLDVNCKAKGARAERRAKHQLEAAGYLVSKSGGSLGLFDLVAVGPRDVRLIQIKSGSARLSRKDRQAIAALTVPGNVTLEYWRYRDRVRRPQIELLDNIEQQAYIGGVL